MSIDFNFDLAVGFVLDKSDVLAPFGLESDERSHTEDRYDPKTGKKLEPVKVVDDLGGVTYELHGDRYDDEHEFLGALAGELDCSLDFGGNYSDNETIYASVEIEFTGEDDLDAGNISCGSSATLSTVIKSKRKVEALAKKLKKLGIDPGVAKVYVRPSID